MSLQLFSKKPKTFKFRRQGRPLKVNLPSFPAAQPKEDPEVLTGTVGEFQASAPEERLARALDKKKLQYQFRLTVGAPRGMPGWKEVDFIVQSGGLLYACEVDTAFTHRTKEMADILHDAIILKDRSLNAMGEVFPHVLHFDGDSELASLENAEKLVERVFGR